MPNRHTTKPTVLASSAGATLAARALWWNPRPVRHGRQGAGPDRLPAPDGGTGARREACLTFCSARRPIGNRRWRWRLAMPRRRRSNKHFGRRRVARPSRCQPAGSPRKPWFRRRHPAVSVADAPFDEDRSSSGTAMAVSAPTVGIRHSPPTGGQRSIAFTAATLDQRDRQPGFGFIASETGAGCTWSQNSRENRLTPWYNDRCWTRTARGLVSARRGQRRVLVTGARPGPQPVPHEVRHGFGYSRYRHRHQGLEQNCACSRRAGPGQNRLGPAAQYQRPAAPFVFVRLCPAGAGRVAGRERGADPDRAGCGGWHPAGRKPQPGILRPDRLRRYHAIRQHSVVFYRRPRAGIHRSSRPSRLPAALARGQMLSGRLGSDLDPCFVLQTTIRLEPGAMLEQAFLLGEADGRDEVRRLTARYREDGAAAAALAEVQEFWQDVCRRCRSRRRCRRSICWSTVGRFTRRSGAGFGVGRPSISRAALWVSRDQLRDAAALIHHDPELTRRQLLLHAAHQFVEGDVLHWWHPPLSQGIRTPPSDDLLWLPYLVFLRPRHRRLEPVRRTAALVRRGCSNRARTKRSWSRTRRKKQPVCTNTAAGRWTAR